MEPQALGRRLQHLVFAIGRERRHGQWTLARFSQEVGTSNFICFSERNADGILASEGDPKQDDYDIWLGTGIIKRPVF